MRNFRVNNVKSKVWKLFNSKPFYMYIPPCAKQTFSLGNFSKIPPKIIEHIAVAVSAGIPVKKQSSLIFYYYFMTQNPHRRATEANSSSFDRPTACPMDAQTLPCPSPLPPEIVSNAQCRRHVES